MRMQPGLICEVWQYDLNQFPDDICDDDLLHGLSQVSFGRSVAHHGFGGLPMDQHTAIVGDLCPCCLRCRDSVCLSLLFPFCFLFLLFSRNWKQFFSAPALNVSLLSGGIRDSHSQKPVTWDTELCRRRLSSWCQFCYLIVVFKCIFILWYYATHTYILQGGPCGVLASVQAFVLKNLLFESIHSSDTELQ